MITVPTTERIAQTMDDCKLSCQNRYSNIPRMDECHSYCEKKKKKDNTTSKVEWLELEPGNKLLALQNIECLR